MKFLLGILVIFATLSCCYGQQCKLSKEDQRSYIQQEKLYALASEIQDTNHMIQSQLSMTVLCPIDSNNNLSLLKLLLVHADNNSCFLLARKLLKENITSVNYLNYFIESAIRTERYSDAENGLEKLSYLDANLFTLYRLASIQYDLKKYKESDATLVKLISSIQVSDLMMDVSSEDGIYQQISLKAVAYNLRGLELAAQAEYKKALEAFNDAILISPDFHLAVQNKEQFLHQFEKVLTERP